MPTVPRYSQRQVDTAPLPGARVSPDAPAGAFGVPAAPDLSGVTRVVAGIVAEERQKADQIAVMDADRQLAELETQLLHDPTAGVLSRRGRDVFGAPEAVQQAWAQRAADIDRGLTNDRQRLAFRRMAQDRQTAVDRTVQRHVAGEIRAYDEATTASLLTAERDAAVAGYQDPDRVAAAIARQREALSVHAERNGLPAEWLAQKTTAAVSQTHAGVLARMLANGDDLAAKAYLDANRAELAGEDLIRAERDTEEGSLRADSQRRADAIVAEHRTLGAALEAVTAIEDADVRDATRLRVKQHFADQDDARRAAREESYLEASRLVEQTPGRPPRDTIPPRLWNQLTPEMQDAIKRRAEDPDNDNKRWLDFLALDTAQTAGLSRADFETKYWAHFDASHRTRAEQFWNASRDAVANPKKGPSPELSATITFKDRVGNTLQTSGFIPANKTPSELTKDEAKRYAQFETEAARRVEHYELTELGGKRKATGAEVQAILDDMLVRRVFVNRNWVRSDPEVLTAIATDEDRGDAYVPYDKIPPSERNDLENRLRSKGRRVTTDKVQRAYAAVLLGDAASVTAILEER